MKRLSYLVWVILLAFFPSQLFAQSPQDDATTASPSSNIEIFSEKETMQEAVPAGEAVPDCANPIECLFEKEGSGQFWQKSLLPAAEAAEAAVDLPPKSIGEIVGNFLSKLLALFVGKTGFLNFIRPETTSFSGSGLGSVKEVEEATDDLIRSTVPFQ